LRESLPLFAQLVAELDSLKMVERRTYVDGGTRLENSAEHSWHVAMTAWALSKHLQYEVSLEKLLQLALIHDLGELDAGDTFLYSSKRGAAPEQERICVARLASKYESIMPNLLTLWDEQEAGESEEARLLKITDKLLPFLHNILSEGKTWRENGITRSQVLENHSFIEAEEPGLFSWIVSLLDKAVENGWLKDS
jgi:putative hydrolase of HD superfamily